MPLANSSERLGHFESSLARYRAALKIDPDFVTSQLGLGDTYALMGKSGSGWHRVLQSNRFAPMKPAD